MSDKKEQQPDIEDAVIIEPVQTENTIAKVVTPMDVIANAQAKGVATVEEMTKLFELHLRVEENNAKKAYHKAVAAFKSEAIVIIKDQSVGYENRDGTFTGYKHSSLGGIIATIIPFLSRHGLSHRWDTKQENGSIEVTCILSHELGYSESTSLSADKDTSGKKNAIQQVASTVTYLQRYTVLGITGLASQEATPDDDGQSSDGAEEDSSEFTCEDQFNNLFPKWEKIIQTGKQTHEQLLKFIESKGLKLAPGHIKLIKKVEVITR